MVGVPQVRLEEQPVQWPGRRRIYSGCRSESVWLEWWELIHLQRRAWRVMQKLGMKGYVNMRKELEVHSKDNVELYTIY